MTQFLNKTFTLPTNTSKITKELWNYRLGLITREQYHQLTGEYPDQEKNDNS